MSAPVTVAVNVYERTYRAALTPERIARVHTDNQVDFAEVWILVNNVQDRADVEARARSLVRDGSITGFRYVADALPEALARTGLNRAALHRRGYFLDFGLAMAITGSQPYVLGWDPETELVTPADWVTPGIGMMQRPDVFSAAPRWPTTRDTLAEESHERVGDWALNYGFSDQVFLVHRRDIAAPVYRSFAPASWARNHNHPGSFESRIEARQRATRRVRATHVDVEYRTNDIGDVITREGGYSLGERVRSKALRGVGRGLRMVDSADPRYRLP